jgi:hypothetical protein
MQAKWIIDTTSLRRWEKLVKDNWNEDLPRTRRAQIGRRKSINISKAAIWRALVGCQVTTQARSGPDSLVHQFLHSKSPALALSRIEAAAQPRKLLQRELKAARLRRWDVVSANLSDIIATLEAGEWKVLLGHLESLRSRAKMQDEREVVEYLLGNEYPGLGPKQARNFLQWLGLSRYEIPVDSRALRKLRELGANFVPGAGALSDSEVYEFVQSGLQQIALRLGVFPCILDACIFASFDVRTEEQAAAG